MLKQVTAFFAAFAGMFLFVNAQDATQPQPEAAATAVAATSETTPETAPATEVQKEAQIPQLPANASKRPLRYLFATILNAEISNVKPTINDESFFDVSKFGDNSAWAEIVIQITPGRSISRFDFQLNIAGNICPCLAIATGDTPYSMDKKTWLIETKEADTENLVTASPEATATPAADTNAPQAQDTAAQTETPAPEATATQEPEQKPIFVRLLFPVPKNDAKGLPNFSLEQLAQATIELTALLKTPNTVFRSDSVYFRYMGDSQLSPLDKVTPEGICGKNYPEFTAPPPLPEQTAAPAAATPAPVETPAPAAPANPAPPVAQ